MAVNINCGDGTIFSPLEVFGEAKKQIIDIFISVKEYMDNILKKLIGNSY